MSTEVHGGWSTWTDWSVCSTTCDVGLQSRDRDCNNPAPARDGRLCLGANVEYKICVSVSCAGLLS